MSIVRGFHNRENPFVQISKKGLWDSSLSIEARGLWALLLSRPDNWQVRISELRKSSKCGKEKIARILKELTDSGYAYRFQPKTPGKFVGSITYVFEFKTTKEEIKEMLTVDGFPVDGGTVNGRPAPTNIEKTEERKERTPLTPLKEEGACVCLSFGSSVRLKEKEYQELCAKNGKELIDSLIEEMNDYIDAKGIKPYKDFAAALRSWIRRRAKDPKAVSPAKRLEENRKYAKELESLHRNNIQACPDSIVFINASYSKTIEYHELGFREQVDSQLRKMGLKVQKSE